jgi:hypothetical protein
MCKHFMSVPLNSKRSESATSNMEENEHVPVVLVYPSKLHLHNKSQGTGLATHAELSEKGGSAYDNCVICRSHAERETASDMRFECAQPVRLNGEVVRKSICRVAMGTFWGMRTKVRINL